MSRKDFNKGMVAGARPFEEKFQNQADKFEEFAKNIRGKIEDLSEITDVIIDELSSMEKKRLYDLNTVVDIAELGNDEKELLMAILYSLANMAVDINEYQQVFLRSVKNYLQITNVQTIVTLSSIENIENINDQKAILQTVMEFLFLENASHSYMDEYSEVLDYFSVNKRGIKDIQDCIDRIYKATGLQGVAENYGYVPVEPVRDSVEEEFTKDYSAFEKQKISEPIYVKADEVKTFENVNLMIEECINVEQGGTLIIKNSYIKVKRTLETAISSEGGEIRMDGCVIDYFGLDEKQFFTIKNSRLSIENTELIDCHRLITDSSEESEIEMNQCYSSGLGIGVAYNIRTNHLSLINCEFTSSNDGSGDFYGYNNRQCAFTGRDVLVKNCSFTNFKYGVLEVAFPSFFGSYKESIHISESNFVDSNGVIVSECGMNEVVISHCYFENCVDVLTGGAREDDAVVITDCQLENCRGLLGKGSSPFHLINTRINEGFIILQTHKQVIFENCELTNWNLTKALPDLHAYNYSMNIAIEVGRNSVFKGCKLSNINAKGSDRGIPNYLIGGNSNGASILVDSCEFENISINGNAFRQNEHYTLYTGTIFTRAKNKSAYTHIEFKNCKGI